VVDLELTRFGGHPETWGMMPWEGSLHGRSYSSAVSA
jgi:hypothetical protein